MALRITQKIALATWSAAAIFVVIAVVGAYSSRGLLAAALLVEHTQTVQNELRSVAQHVDAAKADVRGFLLTDDSAYIRRHAADVQDAEAAFGRVRRLTTDNGEQQARLDRVRQLLSDRELALQQTIALGFHPTENRSSVANRLVIGERLSLSIDSTLAEADSVEARLLTLRESRAAASGELLQGTSLALVAAALVLAFLLSRSITRDVNERAGVEEQLRASEAKFSGILDISVDAVISVDDEQRIVHFNRGAETTFGYDRAEVIGQPLVVLLPARYREAHGGHLRRFATSAEASRPMGERREIFGRRKNGDEFPAEASISKLMTPAGWLFTAVLRDITERKRQQTRDHAISVGAEQLAASLDFDATLDTVAGLPTRLVGAWSFLDFVETGDDSRATVRRIVPRHPEPDVDRALEQWGRFAFDWDSPDAAIDVLRTGRLERHTAVSDEWLEAHMETAEQVSAAKRLGMHSLMIVPLVRGDRTIGAWTIGSFAEHRFDEHDEALAVALAERASLAIEHARLFRNSVRASAARDRVLGVVSHDLRNPLSAVSMLARRLVDGVTDAAVFRSIGTDILTSVDWMYRLIQDLLDVASIEAGHLAVQPEPMAPHQTTEAVVGLFANRAVEADIVLEDAVDASMPWVFADASRIVQVLSNLVSNALRFTPAGGRITLGAAAGDAEMTFWVRDTGVGIPAKDLPHVFDRFWHARRGTEARGHGLGLAIADGIVRAHGGRLWVESAEGRGTTFFFTLPLVRASAAPALPRPGEAHSRIM